MEIVFDELGLETAVEENPGLLAPLPARSSGD